MKEVLDRFLKGFTYLTPDERSLLVENTQLQEVKKGTVLLEEGQIARNCYAVLKGCVREYYIKDGVERTTAFYTEGDPVNSFSSVSKRVASKHYFVCAEDCLLTVGSEDLIESMCVLIPRLETLIRQEVEKGMGALQDRMAFLLTSSPEERFSDLLDTRADLMQRVPQHQIASYLGITPESLSRLKKRLYKKN
jgi:CRP-like cAMP-binding protein